ncbi:MAG TPA: hypothetical protein VGE15_13660 [Sphingobacteriaceae bacterium]
MQEPFDITVGQQIYSIFPEEDEIFTIFKNGIEYVKIQKDDNDQWLKLDPETELPLFTEDEEVDQIGREILKNQE